jgi:hypothetical protein
MLINNTMSNNYWLRQKKKGSWNISDPFFLQLLYHPFETPELFDIF